jgi:hypothetical protein
MMSKKEAEVKKKESYKLWIMMGLEAVRLRQDVVSEAIAKQEARTRILRCEFRKAFASGVEVSQAFETQIATVSVFDDDVITKFDRRWIGRSHDTRPPVGW